MNFKITNFLYVCTGILLLAIAACGGVKSEKTTQKTMHENPLLAEWSGSYGGVPPFDQVEVAHFQPALEIGMEEYLKEIEAIANNPEPASFENTIVALELAGSTLTRVQSVYYTWSGTMSTPEFAEVQREMSPKLAAMYDQVTQNEALFDRIRYLYDSADKQGLDDEQQRLLWVYYTNYTRAGADLDAESKARLSEINQELASLFTEFRQNVLNDETDQYLVLKSREDLAGLPASLVNSAEAAARELEIENAWIIRNTRSAIEPFLTYSEHRNLREKAHHLFVSRGDMGNENDNNEIIARILELRVERAGLLGYESHAHWRMENTMAGTPENAMELLESVWHPAVERVKEEIEDMQQLANSLGHDIRIAPWDYRFYAEKVRKERYDLDENEVKQYLQLDNLVEGMFWVAGELFDYDFVPVNDAPVYHSDVKVWEVVDQNSREHIGLFYFDPYARTGKRSGAWMSAYRRQHKLEDQVTTIVSNNSNFMKGREGEPSLISWGDAETLFHEFGHALHGLASDVTFPSLAGTAVARDYVEFPSQLLEHWLYTREVLEKFALHYETGEVIPRSLVNRIEEASAFNQGFSTTEFLICALLDMNLHLGDYSTFNPREYEQTMLRELGMPDEIVMRHRLPHFLHIFGSDGYSAGYYSYLWSDVLTADAYEAFEEGQGAYDKEVAARLKKYVFSKGNTIDPAVGFRKFRGRDPQTNALMRKRGFPVPEES